jgi:hypothetical protein
MSDAHTPSCPFRVHARNLENALSEAPNSKINHLCNRDCSLALETPQGLRCSLAVLAGDILARSLDTR